MGTKNGRRGKIRGSLQELGETCYIVQVSIHGGKGWNGLCVLLPQSPVLWIEFKNPNKKGNVSASQQLIHSMLKGAGHEIHVIDDFKQFRETWDEHHRKSRS